MKRARRDDRFEDSCDLHGLKVKEAWWKVNDFLIRARSRQLLVLEIVHGHGRSRGLDGVLRAKVRAWLRTGGEVVWFCERRNNKGATLLCLRSLRERR